MRAAILAGTLAPRHRLPSTRTLARDLALSRLTVETALTQRRDVRDLMPTVPGVRREQPVERSGTAGRMHVAAGERLDRKSVQRGRPARVERVEQRQRERRIGRRGFRKPSPVLLLVGADGRAPTTAQVPLGRFGEPDEIADAAVFLASDESRFIVGTELVVDGGMTQL